MGMAKDTTLAMAKRLEMWPIDRLVPYARNARTHSALQLAQLRASIAEYGFTNPILVDGKDGVIAGHGRLEAAKDMGLTHVPVVVLDHLTPEQRRQYVIADNKLALNAGWDEDLLQQELMAMSAMDFDMSLLGFSEQELETLLGNDDLDDGVDATDGKDQLEDADTQVVVGSYRFPLERETYMSWRDAIREQVGFEEEDIEAEIRRRLQIPA